MSGFLGMPKVQFFDNSGDPLNGGKLYTYEPGTTTNKNSYPTIADMLAGTNANANPVILDSRGEANVVLAGNTKLKLDDSDDNTIWTVDNVNSDGNIVDSNGNEVLVFSATGSAVNHFQMANAATGNAPVLSAIGDDTNVSLSLQAKGSTGAITLLDGNGNEVFLADVATASAVNYIKVTNAATTASPNISAVGDDTNIDITLTPKGTGDVIMACDKIEITASSSSPAEIRLFEDTDNGSNFMGISSPSAVTTSTTLVLPDGDGSANQVLRTNGSGTLAWSDVDALAADSTAASTGHVVLPGGIVLNWGTIAYSAATSGSLTFSKAMTTIYSVTGTANADDSPFVNALSGTSVTMDFGSNFSGTVYVIAVGVE